MELLGNQTTKQTTQQETSDPATQDPQVTILQHRIIALEENLRNRNDSHDQLQRELSRVRGRAVDPGVCHHPPQDHLCIAPKHPHTGRRTQTPPGACELQKGHGKARQHTPRAALGARTLAEGEEGCRAQDGIPPHPSLHLSTSLLPTVGSFGKAWTRPSGIPCTGVAY